MQRLPEQVVSSLSEISGKIVLAIGAFDGLHRGHQAVFDRLRELANIFCATPVALYFEPLPRQVLCDQHATKILTCQEEKLHRLAQFGVKSVVKMPFTHDLARLSPAEFVKEKLYGNPDLQILAICVGEDWHFGAQNQGDVTQLTDLAAPHGTTVYAIPGVMHDGVKISCSRIREAVAQGDLALAKTMLGRPFELCGTVVHGNHQGTDALDCPTANLADEALQLPPYGVYAARTRIEDGATRPGIVYVGDAPTIRGEDNGHPIVELHLFDFHDDIYGKNIAVELVKFLRGSILFPTPQSLAAQIQQDIADAINALK